MRIEKAAEVVTVQPDINTQRIIEGFIVSGGSDAAHACYITISRILRPNNTYGYEDSVTEHMGIIESANQDSLLAAMNNLHGNNRAALDPTSDTILYLKSKGRSPKEIFIECLPDEDAVEQFRGVLEEKTTRRIWATEDLEAFSNFHARDFANQNAEVRIRAYMSLCAYLGFYDGLTWYSSSEMDPQVKLDLERVGSKMVEEWVASRTR